MVGEARRDHIEDCGLRRKVGVGHNIAPAFARNRARPQKLAPQEVTGSDRGFDGGL